MSAEVDIKQLAIVRDDAAAPKLRRRRHVVSRYVIPGVLLAGFLGARGVGVARHVAAAASRCGSCRCWRRNRHAQNEGTPLFQAAGWIEPRPTPIRVAALAPGVVERLLVVEDQAVKAGEPVAELVKQDAELAYERAAANCQASRSGVRRGRRPAWDAATTRFEQPVHLQAALGEAEAALGGRRHGAQEPAV